jgi:hypothetical protein
VRPSLQAEIREFLLANGPSTAPEIALGLRARRVDIDRVLSSSNGFERVSAPEGVTGRGKYWNASQLVPMRRGGKSRSAQMLDVLRDGKWHTRYDIFNATGRYFLTNNAATELRAAGYSIEFGWGDGRVPQYRLAPAAAMRTPRTVSVSGDAPSLRVAAA